MTVAVWMRGPPRPLTPLVSTVMSRRSSRVQSQVQSGAQAQTLALGAHVLPLLALQPAQSPTQRAAALLPAPVALLLLGEDVDHVLGEQVPDAQRVPVRHPASHWSFTLRRQRGREAVSLDPKLHVYYLSRTGNQ